MSHTASERQEHGDPAQLDTGFSIEADLGISLHEPLPKNTREFLDRVQDKIEAMEETIKAAAENGQDLDTKSLFTDLLKTMRCVVAIIHTHLEDHADAGAEYEVPLDSDDDPA